MNHEQSLQMIRERLRERGDLPVFTASATRISIVGSDPETDATALSGEILKDANLTTKVLKLVNSPMFNLGIGKISHLSRAVVVLGFDMVKSAVLTLKLVDEFQRQYPGIDMTGMLVNAYLSGGFVRSIAIKCGIKDVEQVYICGLLHNMSDLIIAHTLPEEFRQIQDLQHKYAYSKTRAERDVLGTTFRELGQEILTDWGFPRSVVKTLSETTLDSSEQIQNPLELNATLASLANQTMGLLYTETPDTSKTISELKREISTVSGIEKEDIADALEESFKQSCKMAQSYGLNKKYLMPRLQESTDKNLKALVRQFSFYASNKITTPTPANEQSTTDKAEDSPAAETSLPIEGDASLLLEILSEITKLISEKAHINKIFAKVLEGITEGVGFDRAVLCLLSPDHKNYMGRLAIGDNVEAIKKYLAFPVNTETDLFSKVIIEGNELLIADINQGGWSQQLPNDFQEAMGVNSFMLIALRSRSQPLGLFYADNATSKNLISKEAQRSFIQLVAQAKLALQV